MDIKYTPEMDDEIIRLRVKMEQDMDSGIQGFVMLGDNRVMTSPEATAHFGFKQGQTITHDIMIALLKFNIAYCEMQIALKKAATTP